MNLNVTCLLLLTQPPFSITPLCCFILSLLFSYAVLFFRHFILPFATFVHYLLHRLQALSSLLSHNPLTASVFLGLRLHFGTSKLSRSSPKPGRALVRSISRALEEVKHENFQELAMVKAAEVMVVVIT